MTDISHLPCWLYNSAVLPFSSGGQQLLPGSRLFLHETFCELLP